MSDKLSVTVEESKRFMTIEVGPAVGLRQYTKLDLADSRSIVDGVVATSSMGDQIIQGQLASLAKRVEALAALISKRDGGQAALTPKP
jgi:hypothetical protein